MVNEDSDLYREHPECAVSIPHRKPSYGRNQLVLTCATPKSGLYSENVRKVLDSANVNMSRDAEPPYHRTCVAAPESQEVYHRYLIGLCRHRFQ